MFGYTIISDEKLEQQLNDARTRGYAEGTKAIAEFPGKIVWGGEAPDSIGLREFLAKSEPQGIAFVRCKFGWTAADQAEFDRIAAESPAAESPTSELFK